MLNVEELARKYEENPNLRGAIRVISTNYPLGSSEVEITNEEGDLLEQYFEQNERANLYLEWKGISKVRDYPTFESYIRHILEAREVAGKLNALRDEIHRQGEEERMKL